MTRHTWATAEEMAQESVSTCLMTTLKASHHHYKHLKRYSTVPDSCPQVEQTRVFACLPITPSSKSGAAHGLHQDGVGAQTPDTPELYSALNLSYNSRSVRSRNQSDLCSAFQVLLAANELVFLCPPPEAVGRRLSQNRGTVTQHRGCQDGLRSSATV